MLGSGLAQYKFIFTAELLVAIVLFSFKLHKRKHAVLRTLLAVGITFLVAFIFPIGDFSYNFWYTSILFFSLFAVAVGGCCFIFDESFVNVLFVCLAGYATQHLAYECYNLLLNVFGIGSFNSLIGYGQSNTNQTLFTPVTLIIYVFSYLDLYWLSYFLFGFRIDKRETMRIKYPSILFALLLVLAIDVVFNAAVTFYSYDDFDRFYMIFNELYNMLCSIGILLIMFAFLTEGQLKEEIGVYQHLLSKQAKQYEMRKADIELLNIKCHDLKHQIHALAAEHKSIDERELKQISEVISVYDAGLTTGSEALNIVLMEKQARCKKEGIRLSVIADGAALSFLKDNEIYSLFGNAVDNAIEASIQVEEEKRFISIVVERKKAFVSIVIQNYCLPDSTETFSRNRLPKTTKKDKENHGFGLKSIEYLVQSYDGDLQMKRTEEGIFSLDILLPIPAVPPQG